MSICQRQTSSFYISHLGHIKHHGGLSNRKVLLFHVRRKWGPEAGVTLHPAVLNVQINPLRIQIKTINVCTALGIAWLCKTVFSLKCYLKGGIGTPDLREICTQRFFIWQFQGSKSQLSLYLELYLELKLISSIKRSLDVHTASPPLIITY